MLLSMLTPSVDAAVPRRSERPSGAPWGFRHLRPGDPGRRKAESLVRRIFWAEHRARRCHFLEHLLAVSDPAGAGFAALTLQDLGPSPSLPEGYLDEPAESALSSAIDQAVARERIVEIGSLASCGGSETAVAMMLTAAWLGGFDVDWGVFTATRSVRLRLRRLGINLVDLGEADPARLGATAAEWGRYYDAGPRVVAASFCDAKRLVECLPPELSPLVAEAWAAGAGARETVTLLQRNVA